MFIRLVTYFGNPLAVMCDGRCDKAWGINSRPTVTEEEGAAYLPDDALGEAPCDPGTYDGGEGKPLTGAPKLCSKWCIRECERCTRAGTAFAPAVRYHDFATPPAGDAACP